MSINISPRQFEKDNFVENFSKLIFRHQIDPSHIILEITESVLSLDINQLVLKLNQLKDLGVLLSIDDFGTGYSSLEYLFKLPINHIKIDKVFLDQLTTNSSIQSIVHAIIQLSKKLNFLVVAEGVENTLQEQWLMKNG